MITHATLRPGQNGTKALVRKYGDRLVCVRYRYDRETGRRYTTVELIESESDHPNKAPPAAARLQGSRPPPRRLGVRVGYAETELRTKIENAGGIWRPRHRLWEIQYEDIVALGLESRVVPTEALDPPPD